MTFVTYPDEKEIVRNSGFLYWAPTNLALESGYGTLLGYVDSLVFMPTIVAKPLIGENSNTPTKFVYVGCVPVIVANIYNYNNTLLARAFPGMNTVATKSVTFPTILAGKELSGTYAGKLIYIPDNTTSDPVILIKSATPWLEIATALRQSHTNPTIFSVAFHGKDYYYGLLSGATL